MSRTIRLLIAPSYLVACICLGGSAQGIWSNFALQVIGIAILVFAACDKHVIGPGGDARLLATLVVAALVVVLAQLTPLPPEIWTHFAGRSAIAHGFELLGWPLPWLPVSEAPFDTLNTLPELIPPLGVLAAIQIGKDEKKLALALTFGASFSILVGALQIAGGTGSNWYFYRFTNGGPVGFFANGNHLATLLLAAIPFALALPLTRTSSPAVRGRAVGSLAIAVIAVAVILTGILLNGSLAALLLVLPVLLGSALMFPAGWRARWIAGPLGGVALLASVAILSLYPVQSGPWGTQATDVSIASRETIWAQSLEVAKDAFPLGTGLGTFQSVFPQYEDPRSVDSFYINHVHNDYLELLVELGAAGILLMALFTGWWILAVLRVWRSKASSPIAKAATVASAAMLAHSFVDFPLRTAAMAAVLAMCLALMFRDEAQRKAADGSGPRHIRIG